MSETLQKLDRLSELTVSVNAKAIIAEARAEIERLTVDAARWDYCREATPDLERFCGCTADELDRAIDAARGEPGSFFGER